MAHAYKWRTSPEILARLIDGNDIKTWRSRRVTLKPNEACTFIVNGQLSPIFSDRSIPQIGGGFPRYLASLMKATAAERHVLFGMTGPFDLAVPYQVMNGDGEEVRGHVRLRLQLLKEDLPKMLNYFANHAPTITRKDLAHLLQEHLNHRLVAAAYAISNDNESLRDESFQSTFAMKAEVLLRPHLAALGLTFHNAYLVTDVTSSERLAAHHHATQQNLGFERVNAEATREAIEVRQANALRTIECEIEVARAKIRGDQTLEAEAELKHLRTLEAILRSEDERSQRLAMESERQKRGRMEQAMEMFTLVQAAKRQQETPN